MLVSHPITGLYNGISQQPATMRLENQLETQVNAMSSIPDGLDKRFPLEFIAKLTDSNADADSKVHLINRSPSEQYIVLLTGDASEPIEIYTLDGTKQTVRYGYLSASYVFTAEDEEDREVTAYLTITGTPKNALRLVTIADHTIVVNTETTVTMNTSETLETKPNQALIYIKSQAPNMSFTATVNGSNVTVSTGADGKSTVVIAQELATGIAALTGFTGTTYNGSTVWVKKQDGSSFTISMHDSAGDTYSVLINGEVNRFTNLPPRLFGSTPPIRVKILSDQDDELNAYYVEWRGGHWQECRGWSQYNEFLPSTMPHRLVRTGVGEFTFAPCPWKEREVGDTVTAPQPTFVGRTIKNVFFWKDRLGLLAGDSVTLSKPSDFFNFWPYTAIDVLDDDPIDMAVASNEVITFREALPFNKQLLLRADQGQFIMSNAGSGLTPKTASIDHATRFATKPLGVSDSVGANAYFACPNGNNLTIREYFVQPDTAVEDAADITAHCQWYLPNTNVELVGCSAKDMILALCPSDPDKIWVYKFYWEGNKKAQSSWSIWDFGCPVVGGGVIESTFYCVTLIDAQPCLEKINLYLNPGTLGYRVKLDHLELLTGVYAAGVTTWTVSCTSAATNFSVVDSVTGLRIDGTTKVNDSITVAGDYSANKCWVGQDYYLDATLSQWVMRDQEGNAMLNGKLLLRMMKLDVSDSGYFRVRVTAGGRSPTYSVWSSNLIGVQELDKLVLRDAQPRFPIMSSAEFVTITILNESPYPSRINGLTYEGLYVPKHRSV